MLILLGLGWALVGGWVSPGFKVTVLHSLSVDTRHSVTIFLTPQRMPPSTAGLICSNFIPKKTLEGHVMKERLDCGFSNLGSQLSTTYFQRGSLGC